MEILKKQFITSLDKGRVMTFRELYALSLQKNLKVSTKQIKQIRDNWIETAIFKGAKLKPSVYQSVGIPKLGLLQADVAFMEKGVEKINSNYIGFLLVVCVATGLIEYRLIKKKDAEIYLKALISIIKSNFFPACHTIQTDAERGLTTHAKILKIKFGIQMHVLVRGSKAFCAERAIRTLKTNVSIVQLRKKSNKWIDILKQVVEHHNKEKAFGTSFRRIDIKDSNFLKFLDERFRKQDYTMGYSSTAIDYASIGQDDWGPKIFKFKPGDKVLLTIVNDKGIDRKYKTFLKKTRQGIFGPNIYIVVQASLRSSFRGDLVPGNLKRLF